LTANDRELLVPLVVEGELQVEHMGIEGVASARAHHAEVKKTLPVQAMRLMRGEAGIPTQFI
jgi:nicotinate phosphoribosyltransferase